MRYKWSRTICPGMDHRTRTLLEPGHEAEWEQLNAEKRALRRPAADARVEDLLREGMHLSEQAASLLAGIERAGGQRGEPGA